MWDVDMWARTVLLFKKPSQRQLDCAHLGVPPVPRFCCHRSGDTALIRWLQPSPAPTRSFPVSSSVVIVLVPWGGRHQMPHRGG